jgi:predicted Zn-dependent peptidase
VQSSCRAALLAHVPFAFMRITMAAAIILTQWYPASAAAPPGNGTLPGGAAYVYRPVADAHVAAVALWFRAPSAGFDTPAVPGLARLAADTVAASQPMTGVSLLAFVDGIGGRLSIEVNPESIGVSALVPAGQAAATVRALTRAYFVPVVTDDGVGDAKRTELINDQLHAASSEALIQDALYGSLFTAGPAKYPTYGTAATIATADTNQIRAFAARAFRAPNATLVATGDIDRTALADAIPGQADPTPGPEAPSAEKIATNPAPVDVTGEKTGFGLAWAGPPIVDERDATALDFVADYLLASPSGALYRAAIKTGSAIDVTFVTFHDPGVFFVTATGGDLAGARAAVDAALASMQRPLAPATFAAARRAFVYRTLSNAQTPDGLADSYGWYGVEGDVAYGPGVNGTRGRYLADAAALTPQSVAATVTKYLTRGDAVVSMTPAEKSGV